MRFTIDGSEALESRIARDMATIRDAVLARIGEHNLSALILGGGYGRGEGGVFVVDGGETVYNDYDFFIVVPFKSRRRRKWVAKQLEAVKASVEPGCGVHVDFGPPIAEAELPDQPDELMFMELKAGHYVVHGSQGILDGLPAYELSAPPLEEGARLFMNRGIGLLMADMLLREQRALNREELEFVIRNLYKAMMAMGDGVLFVARNYHPSYAVRRERVAALAPRNEPWWAEMQSAYASGLQFKFRPTHDLPAGYSLREWYDTTLAVYLSVFAWFEQRRLAITGLDWAEYRSLQTRLPILSRKDQIKNFYRNLRHGNPGFPLIAELFLHPRDRILKRLPGLLLRDRAIPDEEALVLRLWESFG